MYTPTNKNLCFQLFFRSDANDQATPIRKAKPRSKKGMDIVSQVTNMMSSEDTWIPLTERNQYLMLGFFHDTSKLIYAENFKTLPCCPVKPDKDYLWQDINLSKESSFKKHEFTIETDNKKETFILQRCHCGGVKVIFVLFVTNKSFF